MKQVCVLGATGSIGDSTLAVIRRHPERFKIHTLSAHNNAKKMAALVAEFEPEHVVMTGVNACHELQTLLNNSNTQIHEGAGALVSAVEEPEVDLVVAGIVGNAGMASVLAAVTSGKTLLLANKESIVAAGGLVMAAASENHARIIPLDSEHNAIYQCLGVGYQPGIRPKDVKHITLTASGGPFRETPKDQFVHITPAQAVAHPKWDMGAKISVDSATLMNKGLEVIEAHWLFAIASDDIQVVVHPQSIIHSMVNFLDGSVLAQMGCPDMQIPIAHGLGLGDRLTNDADFLNLIQQQSLTFFQADSDKFRCLQLARDAIEAGGTAPAILNAANEVSVDAFLQGRIRFDQIAAFNDRILNQFAAVPVESLAQLESLDKHIRQQAAEVIKTATT